VCVCVYKVCLLLVSVNRKLVTSMRMCCSQCWYLVNTFCSNACVVRSVVCVQDRRLCFGCIIRDRVESSLKIKLTHRNYAALCS